VPKVVGTLAGLPGIIEADASYPEKEARVVYDPGLIDIEGIVQGLSKAGYSAALKGDPTLVFPSLDSSEPAPFGPEELVCYCFGFTRANIEQDFLRNGRSLILEKIAAEKKAGGCDCAHKNPKGR
jgi:copper chaperone CopZ